MVKQKYKVDIKWSQVKYEYLNTVPTWKLNISAYHQQLPDKKKMNVHAAVLLTDWCISHPLPDLIHVLGQDVVHVLQVSSLELLLGFSSAFLFLTKRQIKIDI